MIDTQLIRIAMIKKGYKTNKSLANEANLDPDTVGDVIEGRSAPSFGTATSIFKALEITPEEAGRIFFGRELR